MLLALPTACTSTWRPGVERVAEEKGASHDRLARHLFQTATTAPPGKEVRVTGIGPRLVQQRREAWEAWYGPVSAARWSSALWHTLAWTLFGLAYVGAIVFVAAGLDATSGSVLLVLAAGSRLSAYIGATVGEIGFLRGIWLDGSRRLAWLEDYAAALVARADLPVPARLADGIRLDHVSFAYPGTDRLVLDDIDLTLPAGAVVAVVGENGAGKSTLVKLLAKLYEPTSGAILVDGAPLARMPADEWRQRMAGAFQDFFRFELAARHSVGVGDVPRLDDVGAVAGAIGQAGADDMVTALPDGLDTQLGPTWPDGVEVSFGQWQKLALARGFMREGPLLLVLDEPTAASTPRPSTRCSSATRPRLASRPTALTPARGRRTGDHHPGVAPVLDGADGRPDRRHRGCTGRRGRVTRRVDDARRPLRRAVRHPGRRLPLRSGVRGATARYLMRGKRCIVLGLSPRAMNWRQ